MGKPPADDRLFEVRNIDDIIKLKLRFVLSLMAEKTFCVICDEDVEIVKAIPHGHYDEQILSCDHIGGKLNLSREDRERETSLH